ncbi:tyrosine-protein phosphatase [Mycolicibacterium holsaticum]|uniref:tyrosine-protein phosphatase n=1 Tax=Mycolicibacterium holsaticum TaxID=152142 RepID=UPI001C7DD881|nr:tyrosine-protein phosphatase [Mycolicibacterium holsaticum]MDA4105738.1 protein tyrosine phosphatase [Mycolicibacterium holsaticum DSM 44478 = JCM 12374]QZA13893.1 tyrosine-protein phosphatase [Mycolicibacterium holsaticum DSM 44478 = JCM 12374]UNC08647.1 tyrosine-protein phosphatase [Mycolicibacterium holsaticum DSM 44478 = JCM 12374]
MATRSIQRLANLRDLGGLRSADGTRLRHGVLLRSDAPLDGDALPDSVAWPPSVVLDLRSVQTRSRSHPLDRDGTRVVWIPMAPDADPAAALSDAGIFDVAGLYRRILDELGPHMAAIFDLVLDADGPTLVHCVAGKDRTGVLIAVLLAAAGVTHAEILADYYRTGPNMAAVIERMVRTVAPAKRAKFRSRLMGAPSELFSTLPKGILAALKALDAHPGGPLGWLGERGVAQPQVDDWCARVLLADR